MIGEKEQTGTKNRKMMPMIAIGGIVGTAVLARALRKGKSNGADINSHAHSALDHTHEHVHVTHERSDPERDVGGWTHLTAEHSHRHNHAALEHSHRPHQDFETEHKREAHIHDHEHPSRS